MQQPGYARGGKVRKFGYGGDVDGKEAEGVGSGGSGYSEADWSGDAIGGYSGGLSEADYAGLSEGMANYDGGDRGGSIMDSSPGRSWGDSVFGENSIDWGREFEGATLPDSLTSDYLGSAYDNYAAENGLGSISSLATSPVGWADFGALTDDGRLSGSLSYDGSGLGRALTSDLDFATDDLTQPATPHRTPSEGALTAVARAANLDSLMQGIMDIESFGGKYDAVGRKTKDGDRAYGAFQVMGDNIPSWTEKYADERMTPREFLKDEEAQRAVARGELGRLMDKYGPVGAAEAWYAGEQGMKNRNATDANGRLTVSDYGQQIAEHLGLTGPSRLPETAPTPPSRPADPLGPHMYEGDPLAAGRIQSLENGHLPGISYGNQDAINASIMGELTGPAAQVRADEQDRVGQSRVQDGQIVGEEGTNSLRGDAAKGVERTALSDLAFEMATGTPNPSLDFGFGDGFGQATAAAPGKKNQDRVEERTDLPALTSDVNAPARAAMGDINARPVDPNAPRQEAPAKPSNAIADAIAGFFGSDRVNPVQAAAAAPKAMAGEDFEAAFQAEQKPGSMAALAAPAPAPPAVVSVTPPEEEAAAPNRAQPGVQTASNAPVVPGAPAQAPARSGNSPRGTAAKSPGSATASTEVYGPTMPGMAPGMTSYPERGVINQPSTAFHEKVAERVGAGAARGVGSAMTGGLFGLADMASGYLGGPSLSGFFANSTPGLDLSKGFEEPGDRDLPQPRTSSAWNRDRAPEKPAAAPSTGTGGSAQADSTYGRTYLGPPPDPLHYGYGGERTYFKYSGGGMVRKALREWAKKASRIEGEAIKELPKINEDTYEILEPEEWDWQWRRGRVPLDQITQDARPFIDPERLESLRQGGNIPPIIIGLRPDGSAKLFDGGHRSALARERGEPDIEALIGIPPDFDTEGYARGGYVDCAPLRGALSKAKAKRKH